MGKKKKKRLPKHGEQFRAAVCYSGSFTGVLSRAASGRFIFIYLITVDLNGAVSSERTFCCLCDELLSPKVSGLASTCPVSGVVQVDPEGARLVLPLPRHGRAVLVVGVGVVVVDVPEDKRD